MNDVWVVYRDVEGFPRKKFEKIDAPKSSDRMIREQAIPGAFGFSPVYIKWHHVHVGETVINLCTYTETELNVDEVGTLAKDALEYIDHLG